MRYNDSNLITGSSTRISSNTNVLEITGLILLILLGLFAAIFFFRELIINITFSLVLIFSVSMFSIVSLLSFLLSLKYSINFNATDFNYKRLLFKGTIDYTDIEQLYIIKTPGKRKDLYRIKVKLENGRALTFVLNRLKDQDAELMKKVFKVKTGKRYIYKDSIFILI